MDVFRATLTRPASCNLAWTRSRAAWSVELEAQVQRLQSGNRIRVSVKRDVEATDGGQELRVVGFRLHRGDTEEGGVEVDRGLEIADGEVGVKSHRVLLVERDSQRVLAEKTRSTARGRRKRSFAAILVLAATACDAKPTATALRSVRSVRRSVARLGGGSAVGGERDGRMRARRNVDRARRVCAHRRERGGSDPRPGACRGRRAPPPPAIGAFCAFQGSTACCHEADARDLSLLLSDRSVTALEVGLRFYPDGDVLTPLADHGRVTRELRELTVVLQGDADGKHPVDLSVLTQLRALKKLTVAGIGTVRGIAPLLDHPSLEELDVGWLALRDEDEALLRAQKRIVVRWDAARAQAAHDGPVCSQEPHQMVREATEREPPDHHYHCSWPFPP